MNGEAADVYEQRIAEVTAFCIRKLASLEARFITLCVRAEAAGIDCSDLHPPVTPIEPGSDAVLQVLN